MTHAQGQLQDDRASPRRLVRIIWWRCAAANVAGALPLLVLGALYTRRFHPRPVPVPLFWIGVIMTAVLFFPMWGTTWLLLRMLLRKAAGFMSEERAPSASEKRATTLLPLAICTLPAPWWLLAMGLGVLIVQTLHAAPNASAVVVGATGILLGAVVSCTLCYVLAEDALRPLFAIVLPQFGSWSGQGRGIRGRLIAYWLAGSGAYLVGIALIIVAFPPNLARPTALASCVLGGAIGFTITMLAASSITRPLNRVRQGMRLVESGDLNTAVDVDDLGDVGFLQSAFNRMVAGLRERDRLQDVFGRRVGRQVARWVLERGASLEATEVDATVLFVDIVGSTSLAAEREARAVVAMLNAFFASVVETVSAEGGFVNQFQGDGALCLFGAPEEMPDHAARGLRAALALRRELVRLGELFPGLDAAIGISSGRVVAGDIGTEDRHEYTAIGDPVNEASRLCDAAKKHDARVLASAATVGERTDGWALCGEVELRGRRRSSVVFAPGR